MDVNTYNEMLNILQQVNKYATTGLNLISTDPVDAAVAQLQLETEMTLSCCKGGGLQSYGTPGFSDQDSGDWNDQLSVCCPFGSSDSSNHVGDPPSPPGLTPQEIAALKEDLTTAQSRLNNLITILNYYSPNPAKIPNAIQYIDSIGGLLSSMLLIAKQSPNFAACIANQNMQSYYNQIVTRDGLLTLFTRAASSINLDSFQSQLATVSQDMAMSSGTIPKFIMDINQVFQTTQQLSTILRQSSQAA